MKALVTGANGHVGFNLTKALAERGHAVRATVRDLQDDAKVAPLRRLPGVELVALDVRRQADFEAAAAGVDVVFHAAATYAYYTGSRARDAEMVRDSVEGAEAALRAAAKAGVAKVVLTSSIVTLPMIRPGEPPPDESAWRTDLSVPYFRAKVKAERLAWRLAGELGVRLVAVLPGAIGGPGFLRRTATTDVFEGIMLGAMRLGAPDGNFPYVDIRDVVQGHLLAAETDAAGRFVLCNDRFPSLLELTQAMHRLDPEVPAARRTMPDAALALAPFFDWLNAKLLGAPRVLTPAFVAAIKGRLWAANNARAKAVLGWRPEIPLERSLAEMMAALRALRRAEGRRRMA